MSKTEGTISLFQALSLHPRTRSHSFPLPRSPPTAPSGTGTYIRVRTPSASTRPSPCFSSILLPFSSVSVDSFHFSQLVCFMLGEPVLAWDFFWLPESREEVQLVAIAGMATVWLLDGALLSAKKTEIGPLLEVVTRSATTLHIFKDLSGVSLLRE